jgi:histidinol phosphatase-like PHP family hydrolase
VENTLTRSDIFTGRYFFHFHTLLTDGRLSLEDYFSFAGATHIERLVFLEHIRRHPSYDVIRFADEIRRLSADRNIDAVLGFETKLLPEGALDISEQDFQVAQVIGIAEHGFPKDIHLLAEVLPKTFSRYRSIAPEKTFVWVHPGTTFHKLGLDPANQPIYLELLQWASANGLRIERNLRYLLAPPRLIDSLQLHDTVLGADAHTSDDLNTWISAIQTPSLATQFPTSVRSTCGMPTGRFDTAI